MGSLRALTEELRSLVAAERSLQELKFTVKGRKAHHVKAINMLAAIVDSDEVDDALKLAASGSAAGVTDAIWALMPALELARKTGDTFREVGIKAIDDVLSYKGSESQWAVQNFIDSHPDDQSIEQFKKVLPLLTNY